MSTAESKRRFRITFHGSDALPSPYVEFNSSAGDLIDLRGDVIVAMHRHLSPHIGRPVEVTMAENERGVITVGGVHMSRFTLLRLIPIDPRRSKPAWEFVEGDLLLHLDVNEWVAIRVLGVERGGLVEPGTILLRTEAGAFRCSPDEELPYCDSSD